MEENEKLESFRIRMEADANQIVKQCKSLMCSVFCLYFNEPL